MNDTFPTRLPPLPILQKLIVNGLHLPAVNKPIPDEIVAKIRRDIDDMETLRQNYVLATVRETESWVLLVLKGIADARGASSDWLSLTTMREQLALELNDAQTRLRSIANEELPNLLFQQTQLDHQNAQLDLAMENIKNHADRFSAGIKARTNETGKDDSAQIALAVAQNKREKDLPPDDRMKAFDAGGAILGGAVTATSYLVERGRQDVAFRDNDVVQTALESVGPIELAKKANNEAISNLSVLRASAEERRKQLVERCELLSDRLSDASLKLEERIVDIVKRYSDATTRLSSDISNLDDSIRHVYGMAAPDITLKALVDTATFPDDDRGTHLAKVEAALRPIQRWLSSIDALSTRHFVANTVTMHNEGSVYRGNFTVPAPVLDRPLGQLARVRGVRVTCPAMTSPIRAAITPPKDAVQVYAGESQAVSQEGIVAERSSIWLAAPVSMADNVWGTKEMWNVIPYGTWSLQISLLPGALAPQTLDMVVEVVFDAMDGSNVTRSVMPFP